MILLRHELRQGRKMLWIWTAAIVSFILICIFVYPDMKEEMEGVSDLFASMGNFTVAFGMDKLNFGTLKGFYAVECGNILGMGGAFYAAMLGSMALAKEEKDHTAEFLLTHPVTRTSVVTEKLAAVMIQVIVMNLICFIIASGSIMAIGEEMFWKEFILLHLAYCILHLEMAGICFGISAVIYRGSIGIGLGITAVMYFMNIIANISDKAEIFKYITPFGYTEGSNIISEASLDPGLVLLGVFYGLIGIAFAYIYYSRKDVR